MRIYTSITFLYFIFSFTIQAQIGKHTTQVGLSVLPIYDVLNSYPENKVSGIAALGNVGYFPVKNFAIGMNYVFSSVSNSYTASNYIIFGDMLVAGPGTVNEKLKVHALSGYSRYYVWLGKKISVYPMASAGLGFMRTDSEFEANSNSIEIAPDNIPLFISSLGLGFHVQLAKTIGLEFNLPYAHVDYLSDETRFNTIAPTLGVQFFLGGE